MMMCLVNKMLSHFTLMGLLVYLLNIVKEQDRAAKFYVTPQTHIVNALLGFGHKAQLYLRKKPIS